MIVNTLEIRKKRLQEKQQMEFWTIKSAKTLYVWLQEQSMAFCNLQFRKAAERPETYPFGEAVLNWKSLQHYTVLYSETPI
jgi:hypothetical protein